MQSKSSSTKSNPKTPKRERKKRVKKETIKVSESDSEGLGENLNSIHNGMIEEVKK